MRKFTDWLSEHEESPKGPVVPDDALLKIASIAVENHLQDLLKFFETLGRKDQRIRQELDIYQRGAGNTPARQKDKHNHRDDVDIVVPSSADAGGDESEV